MRTWLFTSLFLASTAVAGPPEPPPVPPPPPGGGPGFDAPPLSPAMLEEMAEREDEMLKRICERHDDLCSELTLLREEDWDAYLKRLLFLERMHRAREHGGPEGFRGPEGFGGPPDGKFGPGRPPKPPLDPEKHEKMRSLMEELRQMAAAYPELSGKEQKEKREEMIAVAQEIFDLRQEERRMRLEEFSKRVEELRGEIDDMEKRRVELTEKYVDGMIAQREFDGK